MWLFTKYGFFALSCDEHDDNVIMVRARVESHLQHLKNKFEELENYQIIDTHDRDYQYRLFVPKPIWSKISYKLMEEIDYSKFKPSAQENLALENDPTCAKYSKLLLDIWHQTFYAFPNPDYGI
jgi:hypothetical protein